VLEVIVRSYEVWCGTVSEHRPYKRVFATWCVVAVCKCCTTVFVCSSIPKNRLLENGLEIRRLVLAVLCIGAATWWLVERNKRCGIVCHTLCFSHTVSCYCTYRFQGPSSSKHYIYVISTQCVMSIKSSDMEYYVVFHVEFVTKSLHYRYNF